MRTSSRTRPLILSAALATATTAVQGPGHVAEGQSEDGPDETVLADTPHMKVTQRGSKVVYEYKTPLPNSSRQVHEGTRADLPNGDNACTYSGESHDAPPDGSVPQAEVMREVSHDTSECTMVVETAQIPIDELEAYGYGELVEEPERRTQSSSDRTTAASQQYSYHHATFYEEPARVRVSAEHHYNHWTVEDGCTVEGGGSFLNEISAGTGWSEDSRSTDDYKHCDYGYSMSTTSEYVNRTFCATVDTWNRYDPLYTQGQSDGTVHMEWNVDKWGGCTNLLSFHRINTYI